MINVSDKIVFLTSGKILDQSIRDALIHVTQRLEEDNGPFKGQIVRHGSYYGFQRFFPVGSILNCELFDEDYVNNMFSVVTKTALELSPKNFKSLVFKEEAMSPNYMGNLKTGLSIALIHLWSTKNLLLPTAFAPNLHARYKEYSREIYSEGLAHFDSLIDHSDSRTDDAPHVSEKISFALGNLLNRVFFASDWHSLEEVGVEDAKEFRSVNHSASRGDLDYKFGNAGYPLTFLLQEVLYCLGERPSLTNDDLNDFINSGISSRKRNKYKASPSRKITVGSKETLDEELSEHVIQLASSSDATNDTILEYLSIQQFNRSNIDDISSWYFGREQYIPEYASLWSGLIKEFIDYWGESNEGIEVKRKHFSRFYDYMFLYLPWWQQIYKGEVKLPSTPKEFKRTLFVKRRANISIDDMPLTYPDFLLELSPKGNTQTLVQMKNTLRQLLVWVSEEYEDDEEIAGKKYSPQVKKTDCKYIGARRSKTSKVRIPKIVYPLLLNYAYSVHEYLEWYQYKVINGEFIHKKKKAPIEVDCSDKQAGFCPLFFHNDVCYRINMVPPIFSSYDYMKFNKDDGSSVRYKTMPSLSGLRLLLVMLDTGLRGVAVNWLDRTNYNKYIDPSSRLYTLPLFVNTDKAKEEGFTTRVYPRVMKVIDSESAFISKIDHPSILIPQKYKNRKNSRFGEIFPIFCGTQNMAIGKAMTKSVWNNQWRDLLISFQAWYKDLFDVDLDMVVFEEVYDEYGEPVYRRDGTRSTKKCVVNTPHAIRSTVISERMSVMPVSFNADLVGHANEETNIYYFQPEDSEVDHYLAKSDIMLAPINTGIDFRGASSYIKPSSRSSSLVKSFKKSREVTASKFGFTSISFTQVDHDAEGTESHLKTGVDLITDAPMSRIVFHDTHICPVGDSCPLDLLDEIREPKRCGLCRIAVKTIDNIQAISAKKMMLEERAKLMRNKALRMRKAGEEEHKIAHFYEQSDYDSMEAIAWHLAEVVLYEKLPEWNVDINEVSKIHVDDPEMLINKVTKAEVVSNDSLKLLKRIADSNAYPDLQSESIRAKSRRLHRMMFGSEDDVSLFDMDNDDPVKVLCSRIATEIEYRELKVSDVVVSLENHRSELSEKKKSLGSSESHLIAESVVMGGE